MIGQHSRSANIRTGLLIFLLVAGLDLHAQQRPAHALGIAFGPSFYQQASVTSSGGACHAQFDLDGWGGAVSYRRWLAADWYATGTIRTDINSISFTWKGNMEPMGHWAGPNDRSVGLLPHEFIFSAARMDIGRTIRERGHWSARGEVGLEFLVMPSVATFYRHTATINGVSVSEAVSYRIVTDPEARVYQRLRAGIACAYTGKRLNEWVISIAGMLALQPDMLTGRYAVITPTGPEIGTFTARLNGIDISIARYFTWGRPKLPRWATQEGGA